MLGSHTEVVPASPDRTFAGDDQFQAVMVLHCHVVVVAADRLLEGDPGDVPGEFRADAGEHHVAVEQRIGLRPPQVMKIGIHLRGVAQEHCQVAVRQPLIVGEGLRDLHMFLRQPVADTP